MSANPALAILICTRNRSVGLTATLASITQSARDAGASIEAVIVDNGSTDDTRAVVDKWAAEQSFTVTTVAEPKPGLARSRNTGLKSVRASLICMTDDDCVMHANYIEKVLAAFAKEDGPAIIGGRIELGDADDLPITIKVSTLAETLGPDRFPGGFIMGANLVLSADALARIGTFDERFGAGAEFIAAEDTDFLVRAETLGIPIRYDPSFVVDHFHGRRDIRQAIALAEGYNFGDGALYAKHFLRNSRIRRMLVHDVKASLKEFYRTGEPRFGIKRFTQFTLRHRLRGMIAFYKRSS